MFRSDESESDDGENQDQKTKTFASPFIRMMRYNLESCSATKKCQVFLVALVYLPVATDLFDAIHYHYM